MSFKNWKSTIAFFIFIGAYVYALKQCKEPSVIEIAGYIALYSSIFMMFRSEFTKDLISKVIDVIAQNKAE